MAGTGVGKFSSTGSNNTSNLTVNFAENMAPSNVNNAARELMGHMRDMYEQLGDGYFEFGDGDGTYTVARSDADTITISSSADISSVYFAGRKIRITDGGANVVEGTISSSSHTSTTQTVNLTGISLASGTPTKVELGIDTAAFGGRIILDDNGNTFIEAPTDDTIDIHIAGAKDFVFTANTFTAESGSTIAAQALTATTVTASGVVDVTDTTDSSDATGDTGALRTEGGASIAKKLFVGTDLDVDGTTNLDVVDIDGAVDMASTLQVDGAITSSAGATITTADNTDTLQLVSTDADASAGPNLRLYRNNDSNADADVLGVIEFEGRNDSSQDVRYVQLTSQVNDITDGEEDGSLFINTMVAGANSNRINIVPTEVVFNEESKDLDFRVESNGNANAIFVNGATDSVTIGAAGTVSSIGGVNVLFEANSIFIGDDVSGTTDTAANSVGVGVDALDAVTTGDANVAVGKSALSALNSGGNNIAIGNQAGAAITTGTDNIAIGSNALDAEDTGNQNLAIGSSALSAFNFDSDGFNNAIGFEAGKSLVSGRYNLLIGNNAGDLFDTEDDNQFIGYQSGSSAINGGEFNTAIGNYTLDALTSGDYNLTLGHGAGGAITTGGSNVCLGVFTGDALTTGSQNTILGVASDPAAASNENSIVIGYNLTGKGSNTAFISANGGTSFNGGNTTTWDQTSDRRIKKNIVDNNTGLDAINKIQVRNFEYRTLEEITDFDSPEAAMVNKQGTQLGAIAQEIEEILPDLITETSQGVKTLNADNLTWYLINAVKELSAEIKILKGE